MRGIGAVCRIVDGVGRTGAASWRRVRVGPGVGRGAAETRMRLRIRDERRVISQVRIRRAGDARGRDRRRSRNVNVRPRTAVIILVAFRDGTDIPRRYVGAQDGGIESGRRECIASGNGSGSRRVKRGEGDVWIEDVAAASLRAGPRDDVVRERRTGGCGALIRDGTRKRDGGSGRCAYRRDAACDKIGERLRFRAGSSAAAVCSGARPGVGRGTVYVIRARAGRTRIVGGRAGAVDRTSRI